MVLLSATGCAAQHDVASGSFAVDSTHAQSFAKTGPSDGSTITTDGGTTRDANVAAVGDAGSVTATALDAGTADPFPMNDSQEGTMFASLPAAGASNETSGESRSSAYGGLGMSGVGVAGGGNGSGIGAGVRLPRSAPPVGVRFGVPRVQGALSSELIRRIALRNSPALRRCYEQLLRTRPRQSGSVELVFRITRTGSVDQSSAVGTTGMRSVATCASSVVRQWQFPTTTDQLPVHVRFPLVFNPPE